MSKANKPKHEQANPSTARMQEVDLSVQCSFATPMQKATSHTNWGTCPTLGQALGQLHKACLKAASFVPHETALDDLPFQLPDKKRYLN